MIVTYFFNTTKTVSLHARSRDQSWQSAFRVNLASVPLVCSPVALKIHPPPSQISGQLISLFRRPENWLALGTPRDRTAPPLHSAQFAAPFRQPSFVTPPNYVARPKRHFYSPNR